MTVEMTDCTYLGFNSWHKDMQDKVGGTRLYAYLQVNFCLIAYDSMTYWYIRTSKSIQIDKAQL